MRYKSYANTDTYVYTHPHSNSYSNLFAHHDPDTHERGKGFPNC